MVTEKKQWSRRQVLQGGASLAAVGLMAVNAPEGTSAAALAKQTADATPQAGGTLTISIAAGGDANGSDKLAIVGPHVILTGNASKKSIIIDAVVENKDKIIGYGQVRLFAEAMLFLDKSASPRDRVDALRKLMLEAFRGTEIAGIQEIYAFIQDPDFSLLIQKHFRFRPADRPGELLIKEF